MPPTILCGLSANLTFGLLPACPSLDQYPHYAVYWSTLEFAISIKKPAR